MSNSDKLHVTRLVVTAAARAKWSHPMLLVTSATRCDAVDFVVCCTEVMEESPMDGGDDGVLVIVLPACYIRLEPTTVKLCEPAQSGCR